MPNHILMTIVLLYTAITLAQEPKSPLNLYDPQIVFQGPHAKKFRELHDSMDDFILKKKLDTCIKNEDADCMAGLMKTLKDLKEAYDDHAPELAEHYYRNIGSWQRDRICHIYQDIVQQRDRKKLELVAPLMSATGHSFIGKVLWWGKMTPNIPTEDKDCRWAVDIVAQVPALIIHDIEVTHKWDIHQAWKYIPRQTQKRILREAKHHYYDNCSVTPEITTNGDTPCEIFHEKLGIMVYKHNKYRDRCLELLATNEPKEKLERRLAADKVFNNNDQQAIKNNIKQKIYRIGLGEYRINE